MLSYFTTSKKKKQKAPIYSLVGLVDCIVEEEGEQEGKRKKPSILEETERIRSLRKFFPKLENSPDETSNLLTTQRRTPGSMKVYVDPNLGNIEMIFRSSIIYLDLSAPFMIPSKTTHLQKTLQLLSGPSIHYQDPYSI